MTWHRARVMLASLGLGLAGACAQGAKLEPGSASAGGDGGTDSAGGKGGGAGAGKGGSSGGGAAGGAGTTGGAGGAGTAGSGAAAGAAVGGAGSGGIGGVAGSGGGAGVAGTGGAGGTAGASGGGTAGTGASSAGTSGVAGTGGSGAAGTGGVSGSAGIGGTTCKTPTTLHPPKAGELYCPFNNKKCVSQTEHCCEGKDASQASVCLPLDTPCDASATTWECADVSDCLGGKVCCGYGTVIVSPSPMCANFAIGFDGTHCASSCVLTEIVMCTAMAQCAPGQTCTPFSGKGAEVGGCLK